MATGKGPLARACAHRARSDRRSALCGKMGELSWVEQRIRDDANYEEAQSRRRMSMRCRDSVRSLTFPLFMRILELASTRGTMTANRFASTKNQCARYGI